MAKTRADAPNVQPTETPEPAQIAPTTGDPCPAGCPGHIVIYTSKRRGALVVRYLECWRCHAKPRDNKLVVLASEVGQRRARIRPNKVPAIRAADSTSEKMTL